MVGDTIELRVWSEDTERSARWQDNEYREGSAGFVYRRRAGSERGVISSICITELEPPSPFRRGDANNDEALDIADAISLLSYLFDAAGPLPDLFPQCGPDEDGTALGCSFFAGCR